MIAYLTAAVAQSLQRVRKDRAYIYRTRIGIYILKEELTQSSPKSYPHWQDVKASAKKKSG